MKLYSFYTESHKVLLNDWFIPSIKDDYEVVLKESPQTCSEGIFHAEGWNVCMLDKIKFIINAIKEEEGEVFVYSDVDIQFFKPTKKIILELIEKRDMVIQRDNSSGGLCAGFFAAKANEKMLRLWEHIECQLIKIIENNRIDASLFDDQVLLNKMLTPNRLIFGIGDVLRISRSSLPNSQGIKWSYLPDTFFTHGVSTGRCWKPGDTFDVPRGIVAHHANWTIEVENKIALLKYVNELAEERGEIVQ